MATSIADVQVRIGTEISQFQRGLRQAERELERTASRFNAVGNNLSLALTLPLAAAGTAAFKFASQFETATVKIENLVGVQGQELDDLKKKFVELGPVVGKTQSELADAALFITGAGLRGASALEALEISAKASAIGLGEQTAIAKVAGAAVAAYGEENITATQSVDKLLAAIQQGNAEAADLAPVLGRVLPVAAQLGVSFDEVTANIATFTRLGINAEGAVDGLKSALTNILKPSEQADKALAKYGLTAQQVRDSIRSNGLAATLQDLIKVFGTDTDGLARVFGDVQGLTAVLGTAGAQGAEYAEILKSIQNSAGGVSTAFERTAETAEFKLKKAFAGLSAAGTQFGAAIVPAVVALADAVVPLAQGFASLDPALQKTIVGFGLAAAAAGPLFKVLGTGIQTWSIARSAALSFGKALEVSRESYTALAPALGGVQAGLRSAALAWKALDTTAKATVIGAALAVVVALGAAFYNLSEGMGQAAKVQKTLNDVQLDAQKSIIAERLEAEKLIGVINSDAASHDEKLAAQKRLLDISPTYFSSLSLEKEGHERNTAALGKYVEQLLKAARVQAAQAKIQELEAKKLELQSNLGGTFLSSVPVIGQLATSDQIGQIRAIKAQQKALAEIAFSANEENQKLVAQAAATAGAPIGVGAPLPTGGGVATSYASLPRIAAPDLLPTTSDIESSVQVVLSDLRKIIDKNIPQVAASLKLPINPLTALAEQFEYVDAQAAVFGDTFDLQAEKLKLVEAALQSLIASGVNPYSESISLLLAQKQELNDSLETTKARMEAAAAAGQAVGDAILQASTDGAASLGDLAKAGANAARQFIAQQIAMGIAAQVRAALGTGIAGLLLAPIAGAAAAALFNKVIPKFAEGGIITGPTYGLIGEAGPEVVFPLSDLKKFVGQNGGGPIEVYGRLSGADILLSGERSDVRRARRRGY